MGDLIKAVTPPVVVQTVRRFRAPSCRSVFDSYEQALRSCGDGYQAADLLEVVLTKTALFRAALRHSRVIGLESLRTLIGLGAVRPRGSLRVLDFGGAGGAHYWIVRAALGPERDIRWNVVETQSMAAAATTATLGDEDLKFFGDIQSAAADLGEVDLVFSSGALQYTPDPLAALAELVAVGAQHLFITRTALNSGDEAVISVQYSKLSEHGPGPMPVGFKDREVRYPVTFASKHEAEKLLSEAYEIRFALEEDEHAYSVRGTRFKMFGYFCDRSASAAAVADAAGQTA